MKIISEKVSAVNVEYVTQGKTHGKVISTGGVVQHTIQGSFTYDEIQQYVNEQSRKTAQEMDTTDQQIYLSVTLDLPFGWKSSERLSKAGDDVKLWDATGYGDDEIWEHVMEWVAGHVKIKKFVITGSLIEKGVGAADEYNNCIWLALNVMAGGKLPSRINRPYKFKKFCGVEAAEKVILTEDLCEKIELE